MNFLFFCLFFLFSVVNAFCVCFLVLFRFFFSLLVSLLFFFSFCFFSFCFLVFLYFSHFSSFFFVSGEFHVFSTFPGSCYPNPRDPPVLKILRGVNFGMGSKFGTKAAKRYGECSEMLVLSERKARKRYRQ